MPEKSNVPESRGRPRSTTADQIGHVGLELFATRGFDATTMDDVAQAVGVSRRTLFRYFPSKNDIVWGDFDAVRARLRAQLAAGPPGESLGDAIRRAVVASNRYDPAQLPELRTRMALITSVPALQGHSMLRYEQWRSDLAGFVAGRLGRDVDDLACQAVAQAAMAGAMAAFVHWVRHPDSDLEAGLDLALGVCTGGVAALEG